MKKTLLTMAAALALVGCSKSELVDTPVQDQNAIAFDTYVGRDAQTRATIVDLDVVKLKGFGVNAYYNAEFETDGDGGTITGFIYDDTFMHNTKVTYDDEKGVWTYSPIKYWPNNVDDHLTFFAYAPYDKSNPGLGEGQDDMSKIYDFTIAENVKDQIDLVYHKAFGEDGKMATADDGQTYQMKKQKIQDKVRFNFRHALSRISFDVKAVVDDINDASDNLLDGNTHINIKKVALVKAEDGLDEPFYKTATLDMTTGDWEYNEEEGYREYHMTGEDFYRPVEIITKTTDEYEEPLYKTEYVAQLSKFNPAQRLLADDHYLMILPQEFGDGYRIYIEYDVISEEVNNNGVGQNTTEDSSKITNKIYSEVLNGAFLQGKAYKFTLWLGMTSVKIDATETAWDDEVNTDVWMPENSAFEIDKNGNLLINTAEELAMFRTLINNGSWYVDDYGNEHMYAEASYLQTADIDLTSVLEGKNRDYWNPIGIDGQDGDDNPTVFMGTYDGGNHTVTNVNIHNRYNNSAYMSGLFYKTRGATIKNLKVDGTMTDLWAWFVGGVVGYAEGNSTIENCHFSGEISLRRKESDGDHMIEYVGGVVGQIERGKVIACSNSATLYDNITDSGVFPVGGVVGAADYADVIGCFNTGDIYIASNDNTIGGIVGTTYADVTSCYNTGSIYINEDATGNTAGSIIGSGGTPSYCYYTSEQSAIPGYNDEDLTSVKSVGYYDVYEYDDEEGGSSKIAPWLNYGLNGAGTTAGYEYYTDDDNEMLNIRVGGNAGQEPPVKIMQWLDSGLDHVNNVILIDSAYDLAIARDLINNMTKCYFEADGSVLKYVQGEVDSAEKETAAEEDKDGSSFFQKASYEQTGDIDFLELDGEEDYSDDASNWTPIGIGHTDESKFSGSFDGGGYKIYNLNINPAQNYTEDYVGLFSIVRNATISRVNIVSCNIDAPNHYAAAIAGRALEGTKFENCSVGTYGSTDAAVVKGGENTAGLVASSNGSEIFINCTNYATVISTNSNASGIAEGGSTYENCSNYGSVTVINDGQSGSFNAGGISAIGGTKFVNCHNYNTIKSNGYASGIVCMPMAEVVILNSHNEGTICGTDDSAYAAAGICCYPYNSVTLRSCYNTADIKGNYYSAGFIAYPLAGSESKPNNFSMTACYNTGECNAAFFDNYSSDETNKTLTCEQCYYSKADAATRNWEAGELGITLFDNDNYVWFQPDEAETRTITPTSIMKWMNMALNKEGDIPYKPNGEDNTIDAIHPLIHNTASSN